MPHPKGDVRASPAVTGSENSKYGTHFDYLGIGGYIVVRTIAERDAIPVNPPDLGLNFGDDLSSGRRRLGMRVRVMDPLVNDVFELDVVNYFSLSDLNKYNALKSNDNWKSLVQGSAPNTAQSISYDNTDSNIQATTVQGAIEELSGLVSGTVIIRTIVPVTSEGQTDFTLAIASTNLGASDLYVNGVKQTYGSDYTGSGTSLTWISSFFSLRPERHFLYLVYPS